MSMLLINDEFWLNESEIERIDKGKHRHVLHFQGGGSLRTNSVEFPIAIVPNMDHQLKMLTWSGDENEIFVFQQPIVGWRIEKDNLFSNNWATPVGIDEGFGDYAILDQHSGRVIHPMIGEYDSLEKFTEDLQPKKKSSNI